MHMMGIAAADSPVENLSVPEPFRAATVITATLLGFEVDGAIRVLLPGEKAGVPALSAISLSDADVGRCVLLAFGLRPGDLPIITGRCGSEPSGPSIRTRIDGDRVIIQASREIELRCGDSSIVLTRSGKVLIRGSFVLTHSRGMNRIRGASVHIN
jgi:hypothetical protein